METYQDLEKYPDDKHTHLYNWVFHFNYHTELWSAIPREHYQHYWSNSEFPNILRSKRIETLVELILKTEGDPIKLEKLTGGN